jgi:aspartate-semialdehyde dehydrogenase
VRKVSVAIVGATGLVGQEFIKTLEQRRFPMSSARLYASDRSHGRRMRVCNEEVEVKETTADSFSGIDIALFSAGADISRQFSPMAAASGAVVVDNSAAFRMAPEVPLVVPEVNPEDIEKHRGIIANPNCSTIQMVVVLHPLHKVNPIKRITVATYQSVSGTGTAAIDELINESRLVLEGQEAKPQVYPYQIAFNVLPEIDAFMENGYTKEEWKLVEETRRIMHAPEIAVSATCVRVPVTVGHSEAVQVEFSRPMSPEEASQILSGAPGVRLLDKPATRLYPYPLMVAGQDDVYVGRIRRDASHPNGLVLWIVGDNLRKGAALNAVQIAERLVPGD